MQIYTICLYLFATQFSEKKTKLDKRILYAGVKLSQENNQPLLMTSRSLDRDYKLKFTQNIFFAEDNN